MGYDTLGESRLIWWMEQLGGRKAIVKTTFNPKAYAGLLAETLPTVVKTEAENQRLIGIVRGLIRKGDEITPEEAELSVLLGRLIQDFEQKIYPPEHSTPREALIELMAANNLRQADIVHLFGSRGITSEVISGKREISKANAEALAKFFHVSTDLFL